MRQILITVITIIALSSCASFNAQPLSPEAKEEIKGQPVAYTARKKPSFAALTAGKAVFGMIGAIAMINEGNKIVVENNIDDPADAIAIGLAEALNNDFRIELITPAIEIKSSDTAQISTSVGGLAKFAIDVQTISWSFSYFPTDWTHYRVSYTAKARLINTQTKTVVAEGFCKHIPKSNVNAPTHDELLADEAAVLKTELNKISEECISFIANQFLDLK